MNEPQQRKLLLKTDQRIHRLLQVLYRSLQDVPMRYAEIEQPRHNGSTDGLFFSPIAPGQPWGKEWQSALFVADFSIPHALGPIFFQADTGGESYVLIDGRFAGALDAQHGELLLPPGTDHHIVVESYAGHWYPGCTYPGDWSGYHPPKFGHARLVERREEIWGLYYDARTLRHLANVLSQDGFRRDALIRDLDLALDRVDWPALPDVDAAPAREALKPLLACRNGDSAPTIHLVGHGHIDVAWLWPLSETVRKCGRTFSTQLRLMEEYPQYRFLQSQAQCYAFTEQHYPQVFEAIKEAVAKGQWEVNGGMWVEADTNMPSAESLIRQFLCGKTYFKEKFGKDSDTLWLPDVFGYSANLPQILLGCNVPYFVTSKIGWNDTNRFPYDTFRWRGIDGSEVLAQYIMGSYNGETHPEALANVWKAFRSKDTASDVIYSVGFGDGGGGITREHLEFYQRNRDLEGAPKARFSAVSTLMARLDERRDDYPVWCGELYFELHRGTYTTQAAVKKANRRTEYLLRASELWSTLSAKYPKDDLDDLWRQVLTLQFHDILPGSSIQRVYAEAAETYRSVASRLRALTTEARSALLTRESASYDGDHVVIWNDLGWPRGGVVRIPRQSDDSVHALDSQGRVFPTQFEGDDLLILTGELPGVGYEAYTLHPGACAGNNPIRATETLLENEHLAIELDDRGQIVSLYDRDAGRAVIPEGQVANAFILAEDMPVDWDAWDVDFYYRNKEYAEDSHASITAMGTGPVEGRVRVERRIGKASRVTQDIVLRAGSRRIDFETQVHWQEDHLLLKVAFPVDVLAHEANYEIQGGYLARPNHTNTSWDQARFEVCAHKWADLSEGDYGVALLNDCKFGHDTLGNVLRLTLLRSPNQPDHTADRGTHTFTYALLPHPGAVAESQTMLQAHDLNIPLEAQTLKAPPAAVPLRRAFVEVSPGLFLAALKRAQHREGIVVRVNELCRSRGHGWIRFDRPVKRAWSCNMLEEIQLELAVDGDRIPLDYRPFEIKTVLVEPT
jgi:alpha-mannosidase